MKPNLIIFAIVLTGTIAKGQSAFRTNESISSQLKNGTVPGLVYSKGASEEHQTKANPGNMKSAGNQARNNSLPGVVSETQKAETKSQTDLSVQTKPAVPLASERPVEISGPVQIVVPPKSVQ
jgi:hypothetical protein